MRRLSSVAGGMVILALCGIAVLAVAQSPGPPSGAAVTQQAPQDQSNPLPAPEPVLVRVVSDKEESPPDPEKPCESPPNRDWRDVCQQWRMAKAAEEQAALVARQVDLAADQNVIAREQTRFLADQNRLLIEQNGLIYFQNWVVVGEAVLLFFAFLASAVAVGFTATQTKELKREFIATHRPKIRIKHVWLVSDIWDGTPVKIDLVITNVGLTDATFNVGTLRFVILPYKHHLPQEKDLKAADPYVIKQPVIGPGMTHYLPRYEVHAGLSAREVDEIKRGVSQFYIIGTVQYLDAESRVRNTAFCRVLKYSTPEGAHLFKHDDPNYEYQD